MNNRQPRDKGENAIITEARLLLGEVCFSEDRGGYREGDRLSVLVDPRWNEDSQTIEVFVTCHVFGHRDVDWSGHAVTATREGSGKEGITVPLDARGQAFFPSLEPGRYTLSLTHAAVSPRDVATDLLHIVADGASPEQAREDALKELTTLSRRQGESALWATIECLNLMCNPDIPPDMRIVASRAVSKQSAELLRNEDLRGFAGKLLPEKDVQQPNRDFELAFYRVWGGVLSGRSMERDDDQLLLAALIDRNRQAETCAVRTRGIAPTPPVKTRGSVRTRGAVRPKKIQHPLGALVDAGGSRVRKALVERLAATPGNEDLISSLDYD